MAQLEYDLGFRLLCGFGLLVLLLLSENAGSSGEDEELSKE
jgi:hypothetical protein